MATTQTALQVIHERLLAASLQAGRNLSEIKLIAVSKTFPAEAVEAVAALGQHAFGENYVQEAVDKIERLKNLHLDWHFIGPIQSNKTRPIAENFDWVHTIERLKIAQRLSEQRPAYLPPLKVLLQVNVSGEASKSGCTPQDLPALAQAVQQLPHLQLLGLMAIPEPSDDLQVQRAQFAVLRQCQETLAQQGIHLPELSMGMSADLEAAILEGATMVRVGTAIFGHRDYSTTGLDQQ